MDILIPLGRGTAWENNELRYCLRSIERYVADYDRIFIIGEDPGFLARHSSLVTHHFEDIPCNKEACIAFKVYWAFENTDISDKVAFFNDDYVLCHPIDLSELPCYQRGPLSIAIESQPEPYYKACLIATEKALRDAGKSTFHYDIHVPIVFDRASFVGLKDWWQRSMREKDTGLVVKSVYANNVLPEPGPFMRDCKFRHNYSVAELERYTQGRFVFSYNDEGLTPALKTLLRERFPEPSKFELVAHSLSAAADSSLITA